LGRIIDLSGTPAKARGLIEDGQNKVTREVIDLSCEGNTV